MTAEESSPPPGNLNQPMGLGGQPADDPIWPATYEAIRAAGFTNVKIVARGGYGCILRAEHPRSRQIRALKVTIDPHHQGCAASFQKEAAALAVTGLPASVCRLVGSYENKKNERHQHQPFLVLEWIDGQPIDKAARSLGLAARCELARQYLLAVAEVHAMGVSFGDPTCNNTLVDRRGRVRFVDFGQAGRLRSVARSENSLQHVGGTSRFATKERKEGAPATEPRELHAVAAVVFEILVGTAPEDVGAWRALADAEGVPKAITAQLIELRREAAAASATDAEPLHLQQGAAKFAAAIAEHARAQRRARQAAWLLAAIVVLGSAGTWGGRILWTEYRSAVADADARRMQDLDRQLALRPNRSHPAVARALEGVERMRSKWRSEVQAGANDGAAQTVAELVPALQAVIATSHEVEGLDPVRALLGEVLLRTPWVRTCPTIAAREAELAKVYRDLDEQIERGEWQPAWTGMRKLQGDLAQLGADNLAAKQSEQARADYRRLERGVCERLQKHATFAACRDRAAEAERLLLAGQFADAAGPGATTEYSQVKAQVEAFLVKNETELERRARLTIDGTRIGEMETRITALEAEVAQLTTAREDLAKRVAEVERERDGFKGQVATVAQERDAAEAAKKELGAQIERLTKAKEAAEAEVAKVRGEFAAAVADAATKVAAKETAKPKAAEDVIPARFTNGIGMVMIRAEPCTFRMGSPASEAGRDSDETQHAVTITRPFAPAETEITQKQWFEVMGTRPWKGRSSVIDGDDVAATFISWNDAMEFCRKLTERERAAGRLAMNMEYRLPTEAEWECAARAGTTTRWSFGDNEADLGKYGVFDGARDGQHAHRVKTKKPNPWGLYDMHGNVWEWCLDVVDWQSKVVSNADKEGAVDPIGTSGSHRALRGGCWVNSARYARSADRYVSEPAAQVYNLGFRPVLAARSDNK
ncbi:MAG: SUMF1/EgtB/PvdO family nonheme iron enzyme [Planctomycetes bacterium]|nr:SUMF1/EgtB/PvdO family nonheme iron enzyme [Planctomycetota bacterium]